MALIPGKRCPSCSDGSCGFCIRGFIIKPRKSSPRNAYKKTAKAQRYSDATKAYSALRKVFLMQNSRCLVLGPSGPCGTPATQVHHRRRRGPFLLDVSTFLACCPSCHTVIESNGRWAKRMGYSHSPLSIQPIPPISKTFLPYELPNP